MEFNAFAVNYPQARRLIRFAQMVKNSALLLEGGGPGNQVQLNCYLEGALWAGASYGLLTTRELRSILALNNPAQQIYFLRDIWQRLAHRQREE